MLQFLQFTATKTYITTTQEEHSPVRLPATELNVVNTNSKTLQLSACMIAACISYT